MLVGQRLRSDVAFTLRATTAYSAAAATVRSAFGLNDRLTFNVISGVEISIPGITYVTGYSGTGKSVLLRELLRKMPLARALEDPPDEEAPLCELLPMPMEEQLRHVAHFGLSEPRLLITPFNKLSDGQRYRARLAILAATGAPVHVVDEFLSTLDPTTAAIVAFNYQRYLRREKTSAVIAGGRQDVLASLGPDRVVELDFGGRSMATVRQELPELELLGDVTVEPGSIRDYIELAPYHYRDISTRELSEPDAKQLITVARYRGRTIAVNVSRSPFPRSLEATEPFGTINRLALTSFRTIVHPAFRGLGLVRMIMPLVPGVQYYLAVGTMPYYFHFRSDYERIDDPLSIEGPDQRELADVITNAGGKCSALHDCAQAAVWLSGLGMPELNAVRELVTRIVVRQHREYARFLACLVFAREPNGREVTTIDESFREYQAPANPYDLAIALDKALFLPVQGLLKRVG